MSEEKSEEKKEQGEQPRPYKVVDRRTFTAQGDVKEEFREAVKKEAEQTRIEEEKTAQQPREKAAQEERRSLKDRLFSKKKQAARGQEEPDEITFQGFLYSLGTQALVHLGEIPYPDTQRREMNLPAAKHAIDMIGLLDEKTKGNLTKEEDRALKDLLYDLRLRFVKASRSAHG